MKLAMIFYAMSILHGAFEYRTCDPAALFPQQTAVQDYSFPAVMMSPAFLPFADGLLVGSSTGRPYSEEELSTGSVSVQYGGGDYGVQISWNMFGADFYREHTFSLKAGYSLFSFLHAGISGSIYLLNINTEEFSLERKSADTDLAVLFTPFDWLGVGVIQSGVISCINKENSDMIFPERSAGILIKPGRGFTISWNITDTA